MFVARAWRVRTRPMGTQCLCVVGILSVARSRICADKHSVPTGRPPDVERLLQTFRPSGTILCALRLCYKRAVPLGRFSTIVLQTFWSRCDWLVQRPALAH